MPQAQHIGWQQAPTVGGKGRKQTTPDDHLEYLKAENDFAIWQIGIWI